MPIISDGQWGLVEHSPSPVNSFKDTLLWAHDSLYPLFDTVTCIWHSEGRNDKVIFVLLILLIRCDSAAFSFVTFDLFRSSHTNMVSAPPPYQARNQVQYLVHSELPLV